MLCLWARGPQGQRTGLRQGGVPFQKGIHLLGTQGAHRPAQLGHAPDPAIHGQVRRELAGAAAGALGTEHRAAAQGVGGALELGLADAPAPAKNIHHELGITSIMVTHDQEEARAVSDEIVVMNHGRVEQVGTSDELIHQPASAFVSDFLDLV